MLNAFKDIILCSKFAGIIYMPWPNYKEATLCCYLCFVLHSYHVDKLIIPALLSFIVDYSCSRIIPTSLES